MGLRVAWFDSSFFPQLIWLALSLQLFLLQPYCPARTLWVHRCTGCVVHILQAGGTRKKLSPLSPFSKLRLLTPSRYCLSDYPSTVETGYCDYHLVTKIGYYDYLVTLIWVFARTVYIALWQKMDIVTILALSRGSHNIWFLLYQDSRRGFVCGQSYTKSVQVDLAARKLNQ